MADKMGWKQIGTSPPPHSLPCRQVPPGALAGSPTSLGWVPACSVITGLNAVIATNYHFEAINNLQGRHEGPAVFRAPCPLLDGG